MALSHDDFNIDTHIAVNQFPNFHINHVHDYFCRLGSAEAGYLYALGLTLGLGCSLFISLSSYFLYFHFCYSLHIDFGR